MKPWMQDEIEKGSGGEALRRRRKRKLFIAAPCPRLATCCAQSSAFLTAGLEAVKGWCSLPSKHKVGRNILVSTVYLAHFFFPSINLTVDNLIKESKHTGGTNITGETRGCGIISSTGIKKIKAMILIKNRLRMQVNSEGCMVCMSGGGVVESRLKWRSEGNASWSFT